MKSSALHRRRHKQANLNWICDCQDELGPGRLHIGNGFKCHEGHFLAFGRRELVIIFYKDNGGHTSK